MLKIVGFLTTYTRIPFIEENAIPGNIMENAVSIARNGTQLPCYGFIDVINDNIGWQVKSSRKKSPLTWGQVKAPSNLLQSKDAIALGNHLINSINESSIAAMEKFNLETIGYARLIVYPNNHAVYFEKELSNRTNPIIFNPKTYLWSWSNCTRKSNKETKPSLVGINTITGMREFSWHCLSGSQLHFDAEYQWWPKIKIPKSEDDVIFSSKHHAISFMLPSKKISWDAISALR